MKIARKITVTATAVLLSLGVVGVTAQPGHADSSWPAAKHDRP